MPRDAVSRRAGTIGLLARTVRLVASARGLHSSSIEAMTPNSRPARSTRPCRSPRPPGCSACIRTPSGRGATPAGCATTGSTRAATAATGWATSSASWPRRRPAPSTAPPSAGVQRRHAVASRRGARHRRRRDADREPPVASSTPERRLDAPPTRPGAARCDRSRNRSAGRTSEDDLTASPTAIRDASGRAPRRDLGAPRRATRARGDRRAAGAARPPRRPAARRSGCSARRSMPRAGDRRRGRDEARAVAAIERAGSDRVTADVLLRATARAGRRDPRSATGRGASCSSSAGAGRAVRSRPTATSSRSSPTRSGRSSAWPAATEEVAHLLHRAEALRRVASDIGSRLDLDRILSGLVDHAMVLFEGDRGAVFLRHARRHGRRRGQPRPVGRRTSRASATSRSDRCRPPPWRPAGRCSRSTTATIRAATDVRAAVVQEGFDTICTAPLLDGTEVLGLLNIYHDPPHHWTDDELDTIGRARDPGQRRDPGRPGLRADGDLGRPAPVDPAARRAPEPAVQRARDRPGDRHRAAPADRLPQRPRLPARGRGPDPGRDAGPGRRVHRRDARPAAGRRSARASPAGSPSTASPRTCRDAAADPRPTRSRAPRTTSTSRCSSRR